MNTSTTQGTLSGRQALIDFTNLYLDLLVKHDPVPLPVADNFRITENGNEVKLGEGIWQTATDITYRQYFVDDSFQQLLYFGVVDEDGKLAHLMLRLKVVDGKLTEVETIITRKGQSSVSSPETLVTPRPIYDQIIAKSERSNAKKMIAIANSYFEGIEHHNGDNVPLHPACNRVENGVQTTNHPPFNFNCAEGLKRLTHITKIRDRRYMIADEERGLVGGIFVFDVPGSTKSEFSLSSPLPAAMLNKRSILVAEIFKINDGLIREIEALMVNVPLGTLPGWP